MPAYTVKSGDTLSGIAEQFGTTEERLLQLNPQIKDVDKIYARQIMEVPGSQAQPNGSPPVNITGSGQQDNSGAEAAELFTFDQLVEISQNVDPVANDLAGDMAALVPEMKKGGIVTRNQIIAFLANVCQETDHLNSLEEYGDESHYRSFLGDQWVYHGRGYIMNTWLDAYQRLSDVLGVDLVSNPDLLAQRKDLAAKAAVWFWTSNNIGPVADQGDFEGVCSLINRGENPPTGPINGWDERLAAYERAKAVIGTGTEPITSPDEEGSESVTIQPTATGQITLGYDENGWAFDTVSGLYVRSTPDLEHSTNKNGWLWAKVGTAQTAAETVQTAAETVQTVAETVQTAAETVQTVAETVQAAAPTWSWYDQPWADVWADPDPNSGIYQSRCPTRYEWRPDIEAWPQWLVNNFNVSCNTYYNHPEEKGLGFEVASTDDDGTVWYVMNTSFDVWGPGGRNDPLGSTVGWQIFHMLMNDPNAPNIRYIIYFGQMYGAWNGWAGEFFAPPGDFMYHGDHIHVTYW